MFNLIKAAYRAWQAGQIIRNPAKWKSGAELTAQVAIIVASIFTVLVFFFPALKEQLTVEMEAAVATLIISVLGLVQIVIGRITTTKKVGLDVLLEDKKEPINPGRREEDRNIIPPKEPGRWAEDIPLKKKVVPFKKLKPGFINKKPPPGHDIL